MKFKCKPTTGGGLKPPHPMGLGLKGRETAMNNH